MIIGVLLAAGRSLRFGGPKLLAPLGAPDDPRGEPVVRCAVRSLLTSRLDQVIVVLGANADLVRTVLSDLPVQFVLNDRYAEGMSGSVRAGVASVAAFGAGVDAVVIGLGDQPTVRPAIIDLLIARFEEHRSAAARDPRVSIVAPAYRGVRGNPVLFARQLFPELLAIEGDRGARAIVERDPSRVSLVELPFEAPRDVDTAADLRALSGE